MSVPSGSSLTSDAGAAWASTLGVSDARFTSADASSAAADVTDAPASGQPLIITDIIVSVDTAMRVDFKEETSGEVKLSLYMAANSAMQVTPRGEIELAADKKLQVQTSAAGNIAVTALYYSEWIRTTQPD